MVEAEVVETLIGQHFSRSRDFNGLPLHSLLTVFGDEPAVKAAVAECVRSGRVTCAFASIAVNPHIRRVRDLPIERQLELLATEPDTGTCFYPSAEVVRKHVDVEEYNDRPFTKRLLLGAPQLDWEGFDLGVLERYQNDPRYHFDFYDYAGSLSVRDTDAPNAGVPERDRVFVQSFGVGYTEDDRRLAVVFLRYLSDLSPEHQQYWNSFRHEGLVKLHTEYYRSSYLGEWPEYTSYAGAIVIEMQLINQIASGVYGDKLFRETFTIERRPPGLNPFFRPTLKNFNDFALAMDKLLSENLNRDFFRGKVELETERLREDGKIVVERRGSVTLLDAWLRSAVRWQNEAEALEMIVGPFRRVRRQRQAPAHKLQENEYSQEYEEAQHEMFKDVYLGLMHLRRALARHPKAPSIEVPECITEGKIAF